MFAVFDLDGTLSCCEHRAPMLDHPERDWDGFYRACVLDPPITPVVNVMRALCSTGARVEIWTGRSDLVRIETEQWFAAHGVPPVFMKMRPHGDHSEDTEMKRAWLKQCNPRPDLVFEDRARVVQMWRAEGIRCLQVAPGEF